MCYKATRLATYLILIAAWAFSFSAPVHGADQSAADIVSKNIIGQAESFEEQMKRRPQKLDATPEIITQAEEPAPALAEDPGPFFTLESIRFEGNTLIADPELQKLVGPFLGRKTSFMELRALTRQITDLYRSRGFITSRAYIPPQQLTEKAATVKIIEGKVGRVIVEGNKYFSKDSYEKAMHFPKDQILRYQDIEGSLYEINEKPDRKARAYLIAGDQPQTSDVVLKVEETNPVHVYYEYNNRGTKLTHRARHVIHFDHNNFTGHSDTFYSALSLAEEGAFGGGSVNYTYPIERTRTKLHLDMGYAESMLVKHLKPFEVKGESLTVTPGLTQTFIKSPAFSMNGYLGFEFKESKSLVDDFKTSYDRLRIVRGGPRFTWQDVFGKTFMNADVNVGIPDILGANDDVDIDSSRPDSGGRFLYYTAGVTRIQRLPWRSFLVLRAGGQLTHHNLPATEQYRLGGAYSVRGYPESDSTGDIGYNFSAELHVTPFFIPNEWTVPFTKKKWSETVRFVGFIDGGKTFAPDRVPSTAEKDRFLLGAGTGIRVYLDNTFSLQCDVGWPIGDESTDEDQMQVHLYLRGGF